MATIAHGPLTATRTGTAVATTETTAAKATRYLFAGLRLALGWTFLWAFLDKMFGLGHETAEKAAWINGGHPTEGFLKFAATGPFKGFYNDIAGAAWADWLFMLGLLGIGVALILGIGMRIAAAAGATAAGPDVDRRPAAREQPVHGRPPRSTPPSSSCSPSSAPATPLGLGKAWAKLPIVRNNGWLK